MHHIAHGMHHIATEMAFNDALRSSAFTDMWRDLTMLSSHRENEYIYLQTQLRLTINNYSLVVAQHLKLSTFKNHNIYVNRT